MASPGLDATAQASVAPRQRIGRYEVRRQLGEGGMGVVLLAWDPQLAREVAVKLVRGGSAEGAQRLVREARAMALVRHPNVCVVYDAGVIADEVHVVMELVDGGTLAEWFATKPPWPEVLAKCRLAGEGLAAAHAAGLVHRDFKPHNVLLGKDGRVLVADFGLARGSPGDALVASAITSEGAIVGTPAYMAPEQHLGEAVGPAADQFAFAATVYEGLYGARPFPGTTLAALIGQILDGKVATPPPSSVPKQIADAVVRGLARTPAERWPSLTAFVAALVPGRKSRLPLEIAGVLALAAIGGAIAWRVTRGPEAHDGAPPPAPPPIAAAPAGAGSAGWLISTTVPPGTLAHWRLVDDGAELAERARAWQPDAKLQLLMMIGTVDEAGAIDLSHDGYAMYGYISPALQQGDSGMCLRTIYIKAGVRYEADGSNTSCATLPAAGMPRCTLAQIAERARGKGIDLARRSELTYSILPNSPRPQWSVVQSKPKPVRVVFVDDC
jgi:hypothetical protein